MPNVSLSLTDGLHIVVSNEKNMSRLSFKMVANASISLSKRTNQCYEIVHEARTEASQYPHKLAWTQLLRPLALQTNAPPTYMLAVTVRNIKLEPHEEAVRTFLTHRNYELMFAAFIY